MKLTIPVRAHYLLLTILCVPSLTLLQSQLFKPLCLKFQGLGGGQEEVGKCI